MGCSGGWVRTPNLDRLAREGVLFSHCVTTSPECIPARVSLATGQYPHATGVWKNQRYSLPKSSPTWMQAIRDAGYRTSLFGKTHLRFHQGDLRKVEDYLHAYGLDDVDEIMGPRANAGVMSHMTARWKELGYWDDYRKDYKDRFETKPHVVRPSTLPLEAYADVYVGQQAKTYLENYDRDEPWFCWISFGGPHEPWDTPEPYASLYKQDDIPKPTSSPLTVGDRATGLLDEKLDKAPKLTPDEVAELRADYAGNVTLIDDQIGEILESIQAKGELENTAVIFSSDHGELNGDAGLLYKSVFLDGAIRVPLIVRTPDTAKGINAGTTSEELVEWIDIGPTFVELSGGKIKHAQSAQSLCPYLLSTKDNHRKFVTSEYGGEVMYMDHLWKFALNADGQPYMLFDRKNDPHEQCNIVGRSDTKNVQTEIQLELLKHIVSTQNP